MDAIVTWVDGSDPEHSTKRVRYQSRGIFHTEGTSSTRFMQNGELRFAIASLARYAPFLERIYIVTDAQDPSTLLAPVLARYPTLRDQILVVDHNVIFRGYEGLLPTFNSVSIEMMLHRIPNLAEHYIYLNDDFLLGRPTEPVDWFAERGPVLYGKWKPFYEDRWSYRFKALLDWRNVRKLRPGFISSQQRAARLVWSGERYLQFGHVPHPVRRKTMERVFASNEASIVEQAAYRFRHPKQISMVALANHAELREGTAIVRPNEPAGYLKPSNVSSSSVQAFLDDLNHNRFMAGCVQSIDEWSVDHRTLLLNGLERHFLAES